MAVRRRVSSIVVGGSGAFFAFVINSFSEYDIYHKFKF